MTRRTTYLLAAIVASHVSGCHYRNPLVRQPRPIYQQQQNASLHDPYPDNDLGPEVVGGRPRDFQNPLPEPVRNRWWSESWWQFGR